MSDKLKKHIEDNRSSFEVYKGNYDAFWDEIERKLDQNEKASTPLYPWKSILRIAASILIILTVSIGFLWIKGNSDKYADGVSLRDLSPELAEAEIYYNQLLDTKMNIIKASDVNVDEVVIENFQSLDSAYNELKLDLEDNMYNEEVIDAMIQNYRLKLQILENILDEIQKSNTEEDNEHDEEAYSI
jgi:hypothetical protein